jgi:hypothetical protein
MALGPGSIAFTGYNADGNDNLAFVALETLTAGTVINFTDNAWRSTAFTATENHWSWTATGDIAAGTIVTMDALSSASPTSNLGTIAYSTSAARDISNNNDTVYAYIGEPSAPTVFLAAITNSAINNTNGVLTNTGLILGLTAVNIALKDNGADIAAFDGSLINGTNFSDFLPSINNPNHWITQDSSGDQSADGISPDGPFSTAPFAIDPSAQKVSFSPGSLTVSQSEGDGGATLTFTIERTNGTAGAVSFTGYFTSGTTDAADFGGTLPTAFSGTIPDGSASVTVSVTVSGDNSYEADETFTLTLNSATNASAAYLSPLPAETVATGIITNDDTQQVIGFAADSTQVLVTEGDSGTTTLTFVIERTGNGGNVGAVDFSGTFARGIGLLGTNTDDFGGTLPTDFSGTIPDGASAVTVTITITGDTLIEPNERFSLELTSVTNPAAENLATGNGQAYGTILNDDIPVIHAGETVTQTIGLSGQVILTIDEGGRLQAEGGQVSLAGTSLDVTINNAGYIGDERLVEHTFTDPSTLRGRLIVNNQATGVINGEFEVGFWQSGSEAIINNAGMMTSESGGTIDTEGMGSGDRVTINNLTGGVITAGFAGDIIAVGENTTISNAGQIIVSADEEGATGAAGEAIEYSGAGFVLHNLAGGLIEGSHHAVTGEVSATIINDAGGTMIGRNGSAVNVDNSASVEDTVTVVNRGLMQGKSQNYADSDGDAVDVDGRVNLENWGTIEGLGHNGYHKGEPNVSEAIAAGAAVIVNHKGGTIYGYGRAIQIDNSGNEAAFAPTEITNEGLIQGDGNLPTAVTPEEAALFEERIRGGEAIDIVGNHADTLTNTKTGAIVGGVKMGGGDDTLVNSGLMLATGGSAIDMGEGDDRVTLGVDATVAGLIDLGAGNDTLRGGAGRETVEGGSGDDLLDGGGGNDVLSGGEGADTFAFNARSLGAANADRIADLSFADGDRLSLFGFAEGTFAAIEGGNPLWVKADGTGATLDSLADIRELDAASAAVTVSRVAGNDTLSIRVVDADGDVQQIQIDNAWSAYAELLANGPALNEVRGTAGDDTLNGQAGDQLVAGGEGNDLLTGGAGDDTATGGAGADRFLFNGEQLADSDLDRIVDLDFGAGDKLVFSKFAAGTFAATAGGNPLSAANGGSGVVIDSLADLAELDQASAAIGIGQFDATDTLILSVTDADGDVQAIHIDNIWAAYQALIV